MATWEDQAPRHRKGPAKAIREKCLDCSCWRPVEVDRCPHTECALYHFRFGKNPYVKKRVLSEAQKETMVSRMAACRIARDKKKTNPIE